MPVIKLPVGAPFAQAVVNTAHVYCAAPDPEDTAKSRLFIHALGEPFLGVDLSISELAPLLGDDFVKFEIASGKQGYTVNLLSRAHWVSIVPHPDEPGVVQVDYRYAFVRVKGELDEVVARLTP